MPVFVDDMNAPYRGMIMCHMMADTHEELMAMATQIGLSHRWIQKEGTQYEHFDLCLSKRRLALREGVIPVPRRELARRFYHQPKS